VQEKGDQPDVFADGLELFLKSAASDVAQKFPEAIAEVADSRHRRHDGRQDGRHRVGAVAKQQVDL